MDRKKWYAVGCVIGFVLIVTTACRDNESSYSPTGCVVIVQDGKPTPTPDPCP